MEPDDLTVQDLPYEDEVEICEGLAPIIEKYGFATVENALEAIKDSGAWNRKA